MRIYDIALLGMVLLLTACAAGVQGGADFSDGELATRVVRMQGYAGVEPRNLFVRPGTVVVWFNQYGDTVRVVFPDRKVTIACLSPVNFSINAEGFFESELLEPGAVASLCFVQPGSYAYTIDRPGTSRRAQVEGFRLEGTIVVQ